MKPPVASSTKTCTKCKKPSPLSSFNNDKRRKDGKRSWCKGCANAQTKLYQSNNKDIVDRARENWRGKNKDKINERYKVWRKTESGRYATYKGGAKARGREWGLTMEEFCELWQAPCTYCDSPLNTIGLDRIDNDKGYVKDNITPCCETCNRMKLEMSVSCFMDKVEEIYKHSLAIPPDYLSK